MRRILEEVEAGRLELALNAHWLSMRRASTEADLPRYVHLYRGWRSLRTKLELHALFKSVVPMLYEFTTYWFGQVEILFDRFLSPMSDDRHRFFDFVETTLATLREPPQPKPPTWPRFDVGDLRIQPKLDISAYYFSGQEMDGTPVASLWKAWHVAQMILGAQKATGDQGLGLRARTEGWCFLYGTSGPQPIDVDRTMTAAQLAQALGGLTEAGVIAMRQAGELFEIPGSGAACFPAFQALPGLRGKTLQTVLAKLNVREVSGVTIWNFFKVKTPMLANLSPIEVLSAKPGRLHSVDRSSQLLLSSPLETRVMAVLTAAEMYRVTAGTCLWEDDAQRRTGKR